MSTTPSRPLQVASARVVVTVPADWDAARIEHELAVCISFGSPEVTVISNLPVRPGNG